MFITLEGPEGSGKTTAVKAAVEKLVALGYEVVQTREPGGTPISEQIRNVILDKIWDWTGNYVDDHTVTVYFKRIREKIGTDIITTIKGMGYRIDEE